MSALTILSVLLAVGIATRVMLQNDYRILTNLRGGTQSFYYSIAGIEWSKDEIARESVFPPAPANQSKSFGSGGFAVTFLSPQPTGPLTATITARSVGTIGNSTHTSQAQLTKSYDLADAAIGLRGNPQQLAFSGSGILISGADYDPVSGNIRSGAAPRHAISTSTDAIRQLVATALSDSTILDSASATPALAESTYLSGAMVTRLANDLCAAPGVVLHTIPAEGTLTIQNQSWGTRDSVQLHCVDGLVTPGDAVSFAGNVNGAGILIVRNSDLVLSGSFRWEGLILVTGQEVGLRTTGAAVKEVWGAALVNETDTPTTGGAILDLRGNLRLLFSRPALRSAAPLIPRSALESARSALPTRISQDYWRTVSPP